MKKIFSLLIVLVYMFNIFYYSINIYSYFEPSLGFLIKNNSSGPYAYNPGDSFSLDFKSSNNLGESIKSVFMKINFGNNSGFTYNGTDQRTRINGVVITSPVPSSAFNTTDGFSYEITNSSNSQVLDGQTMELVRSSNNHLGFTINSSISTYQNDLSAWIESSKVSDDSGVVGTVSYKTIYVNVKPHITDYYFEKYDGSQTTSQIQGSQAEIINLVLKVKDYNGCNNIANGTVKANLLQLGLGNEEILSYQSCDIDGKTAIFKKSGITTNVDLGTYTFNNTHFTAIDEDSNQNDAYDSYFGTEDKKTDLSLAVVAADAPNVSILSLNEQRIGGPEKLSYILSFSGSQIGTYMVSLGSDGSCNGGTLLTGWNNYDNANELVNYTISRDILQQGNNSIYACVKNNGGNIGSTNINLIKDITQPVTSIPIIFPANVVENNSSIQFNCSENGLYRVEIGGDGTPGNGLLVKDWTTALASTNYTTSISNLNLNNGINTIYGYCKDEATNFSFNTGTVTKQEPTPTMDGQVVSFEDCDVDFEGIDGRDYCLTWDNTNGVGFSGFESYRLYILPSNITFNSASHTHVEMLTNKNLSTWNGTSSISEDSLGQSFVAGSYKMCIAIMGTSGQLGTAGCSAAYSMVSDVVQNPTILSARFTSNTNLEITTDATLSTNLGDHDATLIGYTYNSSNLTGISVSSINDKKINITINSLNNAAATGSNLLALTGAIRASVGGYNNNHSISSILDNQLPVISSFQNNTASFYNDFFSGSINMSYTTNEKLSGGGNTKIEFVRTSGNSDGVTKTFNISDSSKLLVGTHSQSINLKTLGLVDGTIYQARFVSRDLASNNGVVQTISNIKFDSVGPSAPTLTTLTITSNQTPNFSWSASSDNNGNGSGVKNYNLKVFSGFACGGTALQNYTVLTTSKIIESSLVNGNYSWNVTPVDNMLNIGTTSTCDDFVVDTDIPEIQNISIKDTVINSTSFTKIGRNIQVSANVLNSNSENVFANLSSLFGAGNDNVNCQTPSLGISCSKNGNTYTFSFVVDGGVSNGVKQVRFVANNTNGVNTQNGAWMGITVDSTLPTTGSISSPSGTIGGLSTNIAWSSISDTNMNFLKFEYSANGGTNYTLIATGANSSPYSWNISSLNSGVNYKVRITAIDKSGNESITESGIFIIDKDPPTITPGSITSPSSGTYIKGNSSNSIVWNTGSISDAGGLSPTPITLEYSIDNGTNWLVIATNLQNNGNYSWSVPNINSNNQVKLRIKAKDNVGNESSYDTTNYTFTIDSGLPGITLTVGTPPNGSFVNQNGFDIIGNITDNILLDKVYYSFKRNTDNFYWNGTNFVSGLTRNLIQDNINNTSYNLNTNIAPIISNGVSYDLVVRGIDKSTNEFSSVARQYTADTINPTLNITTLSGSYFQNSLTITGTAGDAGAGLNSVFFQIMKGTQYWNGTDWQVGEYSLSNQGTLSNWSYSFSPPTLDAADQSYLVNVFAEDKSYKVSNQTLSSITINRDKNSPTISDPFFISPLSGSGFAGGESITVQWNNMNISDDESGLNSNSVKLEYTINQSDYFLIAQSLPNNGEYIWSPLPNLDSSSVRIRFTIFDNAGNISTKLGSAFTIDSTPPEIISVETMEESITNGKINALIVTMSEPIKDTTINITDFVVGDGIGNPTSWNSYGNSNDDKFVLIFSATGSTSSTPTLTYTKGSLTDLSGKFLESVGPILSSDKVGPRILSGGVFDTNNNGKLDQIKVTFSENLQASTDVSAWTIENSLDGISILSVSRSSNIVSINLNEGNDYDTSNGGMLITFNSNGNWLDSFSNQANSKSNVVLGDYASPILVSGTTKDTNANNKVDKVYLNFSENITGFNLLDNSFTGLSENSSLIGGEIIDNQLRLNILETTNLQDTDLQPIYSYSGLNLIDFDGNSVDLINNYSIGDGLPPIILSRVSGDINGNGKIDYINIVFSENLNQQLGGFVGVVDGYSVSSYSGNNSVVDIIVSEKSQFDSDFTPNLKISSNSTLTDLSGNLFVAESAFVQAQDGVGPVILSARYDEGNVGVDDDLLYITFVEDVDTVGISVNDFEVTNGGSFGLNSQINCTSNKNCTITMGNGATPIIPGTSKLGILSSTIQDLVGNFNPDPSNINRVIISSSLIINEVMWAGTAFSNQDDQYVELKNISSSNINFATTNYTLCYFTGGSYQTRKTLDSGTFNASDYWLIAKYSTGNILASIDTLDNSIPLLPAENLKIKLVLGNLCNETALNSSIDIIDAGNGMPFYGGIGNSIERKDNCSDGTSSLCWYAAQTSLGFIFNTIYGTPGSENVLDAIAPTIDSYFPQDSDLLPLGKFNIKIDYDDVGLGIDSDTADVKLYKCNGGDCSLDISLTGLDLASKSISTSQAIYPTNSLPYGKYKVEFGIQDVAGNSVNNNFIFYVDELTYSITGTEIKFIGIQPENSYIEGNTIVTINTVGAGFDIILNKAGLLSGPGDIGDWDGNYGFGADKNDNSFVAISNWQVANQSKSIIVNGEKNQYVYNIRYKVKIDSSKLAGNYYTDLMFSFGLNY